MTTTKHGWNLAASAGTSPQQFTAYKGDGYRLTYTQARYVAHAANAYPRLIEALSLIESSAGFKGGTNTAELQRIARAVLRELGETGGN